MNEVKVYDWNGTLVTVEGFRTLLRETEPELFDNYYIDNFVDQCTNLTVEIV